MKRFIWVIGLWGWVDNFRAALFSLTCVDLLFIEK